MPRFQPDVRPQPPIVRHAPQPPSPPVDENIPLGIVPIMISSLPPMMSGADVYARQFYRNSKLPFRRYIPLS